MSSTHPNCFGSCMALNSARINHKINIRFITLSERTDREETEMEIRNKHDIIKDEIRRQKYITNTINNNRLTIRQSYKRILCWSRLCKCA